MTSVDDLITEIIAREGGFVNDPDDPGGATNHGVTIHAMRRLDLDGDGVAETAKTFVSSEAAVTAANPHAAEGWQMSFGTKCTTCHKVVHGSDLPSQPLGGGGLTR